MHNAVTYEQAAQLFLNEGVHLTEKQYQQFCQYAALLIAESEHQNVTAVRDEESIWTRHFLDAAVLIKHLEKSSKVLDIGTGGGIPAIPAAILLPKLSVSMLDSEQSKIEFCRHAVESLGITAECICSRAEELAHDLQYREQFDTVISRAMAAGSMLSELSVPFLCTGGHLIAMKGRNFDPDAERFESAARELHCECQQIPYELLGEPKTLVILTKQQPTDPKYPRRFAKIKRNPL